ncbi:MarR family winged helix-turn-helix transcriptional regulator [Sulfobacillus harzensis]|uniref:Winged helix-turn-helix transcriptional regulator n=1 Tax=Sulfobacillus harzensis TaxID=2729629 RepID=A0A7Y0L519_9FIRM|nr:MarR family winged helix-turn-helix transcriptional regulator [Sulfobacillus harzensis]NMP23453.1 winged helix-turn-helix transcriptional regulator [Sulfobacillus harzensis]
MANTVQQGNRVDLVWGRMRALAREIASRQQDVLMHADLTMSQMKAFFAIAKDGDPSIGLVAKELNIGLPSASQVVERLVKAGLVERRPHPHDRRVTQCVLSERGQNLRRELDAGPRALREWLERMDARDLAELERGLSALAEMAAQSRKEREEQHGH